MIVALDIASVTGVAAGIPGGTPEAWSVDLGKGRSEEARFSRVLALTHELIERYRPLLIAVEAPVGGPTTSHLLVGLAACVRGCAANQRVPVQTFKLGAIRKTFLGYVPKRTDMPGEKAYQRERALKQIIVDRCHALGWPVPNADAADAAALWMHACSVHGAQVPPSGDLFLRGQR